MKARRWIAIVFCLAATLSLLLGAVSFCVDPLLYYRKNEKLVYFYSDRFSAAGLIRNGSYDTAIIGSSMAQNYDLPYMRETLGFDPIKLTLGAITPQETLMLYHQVQAAGRARRFIINIDINRFNVSADLEPEYGRFPEYLFNDNRFDDFKYLLGYETLTRFLPATIGLTAFQAMGRSMPASLLAHTDPDRMGEWVGERVFSKENALKALTSKAEVFNANNEIAEDLDALRLGTESFIEQIRSGLSEDQEVILVLPPRSAVFWALLTESERETLYTLKEYLYASCRGDSRFRLVDMTASEMITQLDHYCDSNHFDLVFQNRIVDAIRDKSHEMTDAGLAAGRSFIEKEVADLLAQTTPGR